MSEDRTRLDNLAELNVMYENTLSNKNVAPVVTNQVADNNGNNNSKDNNTDHLQQKLKVKVRQHLKVMRITCHPQLLQTNVHIFEEVLLHKEDVDMTVWRGCWGISVRGGAAVKSGGHGCIGQQNRKVCAPLPNWEKIEKEQVQFTDFHFL